MSIHEVDHHSMSGVYDFTAMEPRKNRKGTGAWRIFWSTFPIQMVTYTSVQKGKMFRILANHAKVKGVVCPHQVRLTIPIAKCLENFQSFRFIVEELRSCTCDEAAANSGSEDDGFEKQEKSREEYRKKIAVKVAKGKENAQVYDGKKLVLGKKIF